MLDALLGAFASVLEDTITQTGHAPAQIELDTASGQWLDQHGALYNVPRRSAAEGDTAYAARIIKETIRQRPQRDALEAIVKDAFGITVQIADLWPYVLLSDVFTTPAGHPPQVSDGHLATGPGTELGPVGLGGVTDPYLPGIFGVWVYLSFDDPYSLTLEQTLALFPTFLLSDKTEAGSLHVSDGQTVTPASDARVSFGPLPVTLPVTDAELLAVLNRHRAAGTQPVIMDHIAV
jgi:hypothetical protein